MGERRIEKLLSAYSPFPMCIVNEQGKVTRASSKIDEVFIYDGIRDADIFALTGIKHQDFFDSAISDKGLLLQRNGKVFRINVVMLDENIEAGVAIYFNDITNYENLKKMYNDEKICMELINIDNFDELSSGSSEGKTLSVTTELDRIIRQWANRMNSSVTHHKDHMYFMVTPYEYYEKMVENKFSILDDVRQIETDTDFPVTISIGIGIGGKNPAINDQYSQDAMDLALGRGGDQVVIKMGNKIQYYGGKAAAVEKSNKGKSRIMAHALKQLIDQASKVIIMGHKNPDMDSFGSALGVYRIATEINKETYILINKFNETLSVLYNQAVEADVYNLINSEKARSIIDKDTLLIVLDTHRPSLMEMPELLEETDKVVVIDHHRKLEECVENPILSYMEAYASSTSELITEILQYSVDRKVVTKLEAEALLAGITVDTNRFAVKTGVRTFEAASWLRRWGADTSAVKRFFQTDVEAFKLKANCVANANFATQGVAISICEGTHSDAQIINSQAADELLSIKGIRASFVLGINDRDKTVISARSLGEINVQVIMEKFGGGGHLTTAGAQVDETPEETIEKLKSILEEELTKGR